MFDRAWKMGRARPFCTDASPSATLGVVSGRRRQGKSYLLEALCSATGGFYFVATEATEAESLRQLAEAVADHLTMPVAPALRDWEQAVDLLLALGREAPVLVVLDEFPYLWASSPALPSIVQRRSVPAGCNARVRVPGPPSTTGPPPRSGGSPTRISRSGCTPWWVAPRRTAREYVGGEAPGGADDFDPWVIRTVLNPASPLFREARYLLAEEPSLRDKALYHSVLAAVAEGHRTRGAIARFVGRRDFALQHPLTVLEDAGLLRREADAFRPGRSTVHVTEPLLSFYHAVMRPE